MMRFTLRPLFLGLVILILAGCGTGKKQVNGKVVKGGQPLTVSDKGLLQITFYTEQDKEGANPIATSPKNDGTFSIVGTDGKGIAPGKYRVVVRAYDPYAPRDKQVEKLRQKYANPSTTPLTVDVASGGEVVLNVD